MEKKFFRGSTWVGLFSIILLTSFSMGSAKAEQITPHGYRLLRILDQMHVEQLWLAHEKVHWRTGLPTGKPITDKKPHSHCSAFVAATAEKLNIYILQPPDHSPVMLANAQADWLSGPGKEEGWKPVYTPEKAQRLANHGVLVVAVYKAHTPGASGHIAIVRPGVKRIALIESEGPQIIQAGIENYSSTSLKQGFRHHGKAWERGKIRFFSHRVNWRNL